MKLEKRRRILIAVLSVICIILSVICWLLFDACIDRSGWVERNGIYSYRDFHGRKVTGWQDIGENRYYFYEDKTMATGWLEQEQYHYYLGRDGALNTGWFGVDNDRYYADPEGRLLTGWQDIEFQRYYLGEDGVAHTGWLKQNGKTYHFGPDGAMALGLTVIDGKTYHFSAEGELHTGKLELAGEEYLFGEDGVMYTGWLEETDAIRYYLPQSGCMAKDWQDIGGRRYYFGEDGILRTGWLELGEYRYYLHEDGHAAVGPTEIDGTTYYFSPKGIHVVLVNSSHKVPDYYKVNLVTIQDQHRVSQVCLEPLRQMLADCVNAGIEYTFNSAFRSIKEQEAILEYRTKEYEAKDMDSMDAYMKARETVALPGTSEHHLGLAVDLLGSDAVAWFNAHCWDYGFIVRYASDKQHITGITDEPWHFRYVGTEVSLDMKDSGLCLEEYLGAYPTQ